MNIRRLTFAMFGVAGLAAASASLVPPARAQTSSAQAQQNAPADSDQAFMTGLRRIGVMGGEVVQCSATDQRDTVISQAMRLSNAIAMHYGLAAAFNFSGAVGYGSGKPFDKSGCSAAESGWNDITAKYLAQ
jgi:hypothetical protein